MIQRGSNFRSVEKWVRFKARGRQDKVLGAYLISENNLERHVTMQTDTREKWSLRDVHLSWPRRTHRLPIVRQIVGQEDPLTNRLTSWRIWNLERSGRWVRGRCKYAISRLIQPPYGYWHRSVQDNRADDVKYLKPCYDLWNSVRLYQDPLIDGIPRLWSDEVIAFDLCPAPKEFSDAAEGL
jgi:hypothetical protein